MAWSHSSVQKKQTSPRLGQIPSQIPEGGEGNRGQMPHICHPPLGLNIDSCIRMTTRMIKGDYELTVRMESKFAVCRSLLAQQVRASLVISCHGNPNTVQLLWVVSCIPTLINCGITSASLWNSCLQ